MGQILNIILSNALYVSLLVIVISALVAFFVKLYVRDRCLRDFDGFLVTVEDKSDDATWGTLRVYSSGIELLYAAEFQAPKGHVENSFILYEQELGGLRTLYRFHDDQSKKRQQMREKDIRRTYQPNIFRRVGRGVRNVISVFRDALVQMMNAILATRAAQAPGDLMLSRHKDLAKSGEQLVTSTIGNAYEPILERYVGQYVVFEVRDGDDVHDGYGILKEYSTKYLELLNVRLEVPLKIYVKDREYASGSPVQIEQHERSMRVTNSVERTVLVQAIEAGDSVRAVNVPVEPAESAEIALADGEDEVPVRLDLAVRCLADVIVPRTLAVVRHGGKREKPSLETLLGLNDLPYLPWVKRLLGVRIHEHPGDRA
jgi:hypothetical protein